MKIFTINLFIAFLFSQSVVGQHYGLDFADKIYQQAQRVTIDAMDNTKYDGITYEAWIKLDSYYDQNNSDISGSFVFCRQFSIASDFGVVLLILSEDNEIGDNRKIGYGMNFGSNGNTHVGLHSNSEVALNEWHHLAATWDGDSMVVYLDGYWDGSVDVSSLGTYWDPATTFYLGYRDFFGRTSFDGMIDDARVWSFAKSQTQVKGGMYKEMTGTETGLLAYWNMNDGSGQTVTDKTGTTAHNGYLGNSSGDATYDPSWVVSTAPVPYYSVADGNWNSDASWANYQNAPTAPWAIVDVKNDITATSSVVVDSLAIYPTASLTINTGFDLTVDGTNGMRIQADATAMGSLIHTTTGVKATTELYLTADNWHYLSPAVTGSKSESFTGSYLRTFDENTYTWNPYITGLTATLSPLTGYACWVPTTAVTADLSGTLNKGLYSLTVTLNNGLANPGWNLVGNPYPSSLDWDAASGWNKSNVDNTLYYYSDVDDEYHYYIGAGGSTPSVGVNDGTNEIPPMQGFFVKATANGTFSVDDDARIHSSQGFYKNSAKVYAAVPLIRLQITGNSDNDETVIRFVENATEGHDGQFDAWKLFSDSHPQIYSTTLNGEELAVNSLPEMQENRIVPIGFITPQAATFSLKISEWLNIPESVSIYLEDLFTGEMFEFNEASEYTFSSYPDDNTHRFNLHFQQTSGVGDYVGKGNINIYSWRNNIYVNDPDANQGNIVVFDIQGREVKQLAASMDGFSHFEMSADIPGYYIVHYISDSKVQTAKVFIH